MQLYVDGKGDEPPLMIGAGDEEFDDFESAQCVDEWDVKERYWDEYDAYDD